MSEEMLSSIRQIFKQLIADTYMTFQGTRGARHGIQPWHKHHVLAEEFISTRRFLTASRTMKCCMQASSNITGRRNGAHIWITSEQSIFRTRPSPQQLERYAALYHFRYGPKQMARGAIKSRPDYHQTTLAIVSMNKEAGQIQESKRRHNYREDLDPEKLDWLKWLSHNWKWHFAENRISGLNSTQWRHQKSVEAHASGNREAFTDDGRCKANRWTTSWEKSRWTWYDEV